MKADYDMPSVQKARQKLVRDMANAAKAKRETKLGQTAARITTLADYLQVASNKVITPDAAVIAAAAYLANRDEHGNVVIQRDNI